jgi:hypothetical protein
MTLTMLFGVKQDLRHKNRLVAGGHLVDSLDRISVKLLHVISHKAGLEQLCGNMSLAFVNAYTKELVYAIAGPEFREP